MSMPQTIRDEQIPNLDLAYAHPANPKLVNAVLEAEPDTDDGRSEWLWLRLRNGDLMLGVFPRGETYEEVEADAQFPTLPELPEGWRVIDYREPRFPDYYVPKRGRERIVQSTISKPGAYGGDPKWIVKPPDEPS